MDRIEPVELTDRIDPVELIDHSEPRFVTGSAGGRITIDVRCPIRAVARLDGGHGDGVTIGLPAGESTYQSPPALVRAWPVACPGALSGGHR